MTARELLLRVAAVVLLAPALLLTGVRLVQPPGALWVQLVAFTPVALVPYAVVLLAALVRLVRRRSAAAGVLAAAAVLGLVVHGWWFAPLLTEDGPGPLRGEESLTVMTANMFFGQADAAALVELADEEEVDVLVVQEVTGPLLGDLRRAGLEDVLAHSAGSPRGGAAGTMVFADRRLGEPEPVPTGFDSWLVDVAGVSLLAVHPVAPLDVDRWRHDHAVLREAVVAARPDLVVGDFNATVDHRPMGALCREGWRSVTDLAGEGWQPTWSPGGLFAGLDLPLPPVAQIDHVLVGPGVAGLGSRTDVVPGTDHRALVAEVVPGVDPGADAPSRPACG